ncbi:MAG: hypothetical protein IID49_03665, partial [Proteobacteria bacterium]|nr:hypothetical protein [Pseudomonadota bacterium]
WDAVSADATALEQGQSPERVAARPLWPEKLPGWAADAWAKLEDHLLKADEGWEVWTGWYEDRLHGRPFNKALEEARVLIPDEIWEQGPKAVNAEIARLMKERPPEGNGAGGRGAASPPNEEFNERLSNLRSQIEALKKAVQTMRAEVDALEPGVKSVKGQIADIEKRCKNSDRKIDELEARQREAVLKTEAELAGLKEAYLQKTAFEAPVELWTAKQTEHETQRDTAFKHFVAGLGVSALFVLGIVFVIAYASETVDALFTAAGCDPAKPGTCDRFSFRGLLVTGAVLTLFTLCLWFTRLQMKIYLSERHLALDARERRAFAQAYIALLAQGDTSEEAKEHKTLVYAALFRPTVDGIIKDDGGVDPALSAALSKFLMKS